MFYKAKVRLEGEENRDWELFYEDGRVEKYYAVGGGSAERPSDNEYVYNYDPKLAELLDNLSHNYVVAAPNQVLEFEVRFANGLESCVVTHSEFI